MVLASATSNDPDQFLATMIQNHIRELHVAETQSLVIEILARSEI
jgi:hypothetical protein